MGTRHVIDSPLAFRDPPSEESELWHNSQGLSTQSANSELRRDLVEENEKKTAALSELFAEPDESQRAEINHAGWKIQQRIREDQELDEEEEARKKAKWSEIEATLKSIGAWEHLRVFDTKKGARAYVLGTSNQSQESTARICDVLSVVRPDTVVLPLNGSYFKACMSEPLTEEEKKKFLSESWRIVFVSMARRQYDATCLQSICSVADGDDGVDSERTAFRQGLKLGAALVFGGRDIEVATSRMWAKASLFEKLALGLGLVNTWMSGPVTKEEAVEIKTSDEFQTTMSESLPAILEMGHEHDLYFTDSIHRSLGSTIVAVVNKDRLESIEEAWNWPIDRAALLQMPERRAGIVSFVALTALRVVGWCMCVATSFSSKESQKEQ